MASAASVASVARCSILWLRLHEYHPLLHFARHPSLSILARFRPNVPLLLPSFSICHEFALRSSPPSDPGSTHPSSLRTRTGVARAPPPPFYDYTRLTRIYERACTCVHANSAHKFARVCVCVCKYTPPPAYVYLERITGREREIHIAMCARIIYLRPRTRREGASIVCARAWSVANERTPSVGFVVESGGGGVKGNRVLRACAACRRCTRAWMRGKGVVCIYINT